MIVTFCGHRNFQAKIGVKEKIFKIFESLKAESQTLIFYCGGYGNFDRFASGCVNQFKRLYPFVKSYYISPYLSEIHLQKKLSEGCYDGVYYPSLENVPKRFAIIKRNEWMVDQADIIVSYVRYPCGGASRTVEYAKRKKKRIINLI